MKTIQAWIRLIAGLKYSLFFQLVLLALPLTAFRWMPGHPLLGGVFLELSSWHVFFFTMPILGATWVFFPPAALLPADNAPPSGAYLYTLLWFLIWAITGLDFHLGRWHVSPLLALLLYMGFVYAVTDVDRHYAAAAVAEGAGGSLTPVEVVTAPGATSPQPRNLVVVASAGGGIQSAGWTTLVLQRMLVARPRLADEIRLLSTVSGGSVGAAYYTIALRKLNGSRAPSDLDRDLGEAFDQATTSSLSSTVYGLTFLGFGRAVLGHSLPILERWDRGRLLETSWQRIAGDDPTLLELRGAVAARRLPALILNATVMESGHRLMLTPVDFSGLAANRRAATQSDLLGGGGRELDVGLWTAARLSATFPYVSPAAAAPPKVQRLAAGETWEDPAYHLIDGGYYDNAGVTSALDWLEPVLEARLANAAGDPGLPTFRKVLFLQLEPFPHGGDAKPSTGLPSEIAGPLLGLLKIRTGSQASRNQIDLERARRSWNARLKGAGVCLETAELRPSSEHEKGPLSWHLTRTQIRELEKQWPQELDDAPAAIRDEWRRIEAFLEGEDCPNA